MQSEEVNVYSSLRYYPIFYTLLFLASFAVFFIYPFPYNSFGTLFGASFYFFPQVLVALLITVLIFSNVSHSKKKKIAVVVFPVFWFPAILMSFAMVLIPFLGVLSIVGAIFHYLLFTFFLDAAENPQLKRSWLVVMLAVPAIILIMSSLPGLLRVV